MILRHLAFALLLPLLTAVAAPAQALEIVFQATPIDLSTPGAELWQYSYASSSQSFSAGQGFSILFRPEETESLVAFQPAGSDWDVIEIQPDPLLPDFGAYDALALVDAPDLSVIFVAEFIWTGVGQPGAQDFVVYDIDFSPIHTGVTVPVPEPTTALLLAVGLFGLAVHRGRGDPHTSR